MRLRHKPWARETLAAHPDIVVAEPERYRGKWHMAFDQAQPLYVEVGTGKGKFLTEMAQKYPDIHFIGIEKYESVLLTALERVKKAGISNVRLLAQDVAKLDHFFAEDELDRLFINFTDPWPKNRHERRRLTYQSFLMQYQYVLNPDGEVHFKTDNRGLFEYSLQSMSTYGMAFHDVSLDLHKSGLEGNVMTEYEERFVQKGLPIYRLEARFTRGKVGALYKDYKN
ncbi:tRNA (guanosine(46)-N7)-methyltransferase TrmB [Bacillus sp. FSL W7-1360]